MSSMVGFPGQAASVMFTVESSNVLTAAQAGPTYTLYKNGSVVDTTSGSPTVALTAANPATGVYRVSFTMPSGWAVTDVVELFAATGTTGSAIVGRWVLVPATLLTVPTFPSNFAALGISVGGAISTVTDLTNMPTIPANWLTAAGLAADAVAELQSGLATAVALSATHDDVHATYTIVSEFADVDGNVDTTIRSWLGLASANLDTQLSAIDNFIDTEIASLATELAKVPKVGSTHRYTQVAADEGDKSADVSITEAT